MSKITIKGQKRLALVSGRAHPELAADVAKILGTDLVPTTAYDFANGETFVRFEESVRGVDAFVIQSHPYPINQWIMEQLLMVDALKRASAKRITVVAPFFPYGRQDKKHKGREPISARLMSDLFAAAGADRIMSVDLHAPQIQGFFNGPVDHLWALPTLADYVAEKWGHEDLTVVSPDSGRVRVADIWADRLGAAGGVGVIAEGALGGPGGAIFRSGAAGEYRGGDWGLRRHDGAAEQSGPGDHGGYVGGAPVGGFGPADLDHAGACAGLALADGSGGHALVPHRAAVPAEGGRGRRGAGDAC